MTPVPFPVDRRSTSTSPRIDPRLVAAIFRLDDRSQPYAETCRRVGELADELMLPRPAYDTVRRLVRGHRRRAEAARSLAGPVLGDLLQGRLTVWDLDRVQEILELRATDRAVVRRELRE